MFTIAAFVDALSLEEVGRDRYGRTASTPRTAWSSAGSCWPNRSWRGWPARRGSRSRPSTRCSPAAPSPDAPLEIAVERMHSGRSLASSTVTISQGDTLVTRSLVLLSADEPDVIRHADTRRSDSTPDDAGGTVRGEGAWEILIVGDVDISDPELVGPARARCLGPLRRTRPTTPPPTRPSSPTRRTASSSERPCARTPASARPRRTGRSRPVSSATRSPSTSRARPREWHLLQQRSTYAGHGRSYGQGDIFRRDGQLAASFVQDAMIRARSGGAGAL